MYVCRLFNNIEFRANRSLYTIAQYIKTSVDSTMIKIRNEKKKYIFIYKFTSCTLRALLRLHFNLNETRYFVLIVFIEELLNIQYFLFFLFVSTRINRKVFQRVSKPHTVVYARSKDFSNFFQTLVATSLCFVDGHCKSESHRKLQSLNSNGISVGIIGMHTTVVIQNFITITTGYS
jgi:hypothetical protein